MPLKAIRLTFGFGLPVAAVLVLAAPSGQLWAQGEQSSVQPVACHDCDEEADDSDGSSCCPSHRYLERSPVTPTPSPAETAPTEPTPDMFTQPDAAFAPGQSTLLASQQVAVSPGGYIDNAIPRTRFRLRFDAAYDNSRPDRAEFFYAKCGCFRRVGVDPGAAGPVPDNPNAARILETEVDYQDIRMQMEYAAFRNGSVFIELPFRFLNPTVNDNTAGIGDLNFGAKYALIACPDHYLTLQLRAYAPTGDSERGLGTDHYSIEPGLLYLRQVNRDLVVFGELRHWVPIDGNDGPVPPNLQNADFAGSVLRYGVGAGYTVYRSECRGLTVTPVLEFVGWSVLDGLATASSDGTLATFTLEDAETTIVNSKIGVRIGLGDTGFTPAGYGNSLYVGYGRALTGQHWYEDIVRAEYRINF